MALMFSAQPPPARASSLRYWLVRLESLTYRSVRLESLTYADRREGG